ncbi:hypothetical protein EB796_025168 [Bugula neritina]|uniref:Uncharacterized protein n=1 Tax=Bugula neritina TaxID=10212 RepID=A0A7J7ISK9_BUGNE|nr:hypothetical protein EB796_025168 [Bugula neritina]
MERFLTGGIQRSMFYERKLGHALSLRRRKQSPSKAPKTEDNSDSDSEKEIKISGALRQGVAEDHQGTASNPASNSTSNLPPQHDYQQSSMTSDNRPIAMVEPVQQHQDPADSSSRLLISRILNKRTRRSR